MNAGSIAALLTSLLLATASSAAAQQSSASPPAPPPAPAALSVPNPLAGLHPGTTDLYRSPDGSDRFQHSSAHPAPPPVIIPGVYVPWAYYTFVDHVPRHRRAARRVAVMRGRLVLGTIPDLAQVYIDGFYVGLAEEFGLRGRALDLPVGPHHVELRAPGYETLTFSVMIEPDGILRYPGDMRLLSSAPPRTLPQPATQKSFYVIPNCYAGDKPPTGALPRGCDLKKLQTRK
jgi:hypothetical protein